MAKLPSIEDYITAITTPRLIIAKELVGGACVRFNGNDVERYAGGFCVVFPFESPNGKKAVRCWHAQLNDIQKRTKLISEELERVHLPYFVKFHYVDKGLATSLGVEPVVVMDWVKALPLKEFIKHHLNDKQALELLNNNFLAMVKDLHHHNLSHGDLQHGNMLVKDDGSIILVDYDSMFVPQIAGFDDEIKGLEGYQHEARWNNDKVSPKADYFSELVIYLSIMSLIEKPILWDDLKMEDSETMLFSGKDIRSKGQTPIFHVLKSFSSLRPLTDKLIDFMHRSSIDDLEPLEKCIIPSSNKIVETLSKKWNETTKATVVPHPVTPINTNDIERKWQQPVNQNMTLEERRRTVDGISHKWVSK